MPRIERIICDHCGRDITDDRANWGPVVQRPGKRNIYLCKKCYNKLSKTDYFKNLGF